MSAVCVTGLVVVDTGSYWSTFGQSVIMVLFQIGGFGMMTAATLLGLMVNRSLRLRAKLVTQVETHSLGLGDVASVAKLVFVVTLACELVVTALLTLAGYSLTDTVVVFDRIRENLRLRRREHEVTMINNAINQVLSRTIITSLTVVLVLIPLTVGGGEVLHDFSLALLWGVIFGTYSSVFVASPLLLLWPGGSGRLLKRA